MFCCCCKRGSVESEQRREGCALLRFARRVFCCKPSSADGEQVNRSTGGTSQLRKLFRRLRPAGLSQAETVAEIDDRPRFSDNDNRNGDERREEHQLPRTCRKLKSDYLVGRKLGKGGYGSVYEGTRRSDGLQVALKFVKKTLKSSNVKIPEHPVPLPQEVALLMRANEGSRVGEIIALIDWYEERSQYIIVMERPQNCENLYKFVQRYGGCISEEAARHIMRQVVYASLVCTKRGVLHRDIKLENLLLNNRSMTVKLIDFGAGDFLRKTPYTSFTGTRQFCPPEYFCTGKYRGEAATVFSLGVLLFRMLHGRYPEKEDYTWPSEDLSKECCQLISCCLQQDPNLRLRLDWIQYHRWFRE